MEVQLTPDSKPSPVARWKADDFRAKNRPCTKRSHCGKNANAVAWHSWQPSTKPAPPWLAAKAVSSTPESMRQISADVKEHAPRPPDF